MILYQIAQWMEERRRLKQIIDESEGGNQLLQYRKEQVEQQMLLKATKWIELEQKSEPQTQPFVNPYMLESLPDSQDIATLG
ncbi:MAG: hypothetical protein K0Q81_537 [Paenibacillus sp.]|nr:hypothetical protein [Paenibacillus sp.]